MKLTTITAPTGVNYSDAPQKSPEWIALRPGRVGASELKDWMGRALVKNKDTGEKERTGAPLKPRTDLERKKAFEKAFNVSFNTFVTPAMQEGIDNEAFVRKQYELSTGTDVTPAGAFYDDWSIASPDGLIGEVGGLEIKWLQDANWTEVVISGQPLEEHHYQIQGNLRLSGRTWWDYVAANGNTGRFVTIRVQRDEKLIAEIDASVREIDDVTPLDVTSVQEFTSEAVAAVEW